MRLILIVCFWLLATVTMAQQTITVHGQGDVDIVPDRVSIHLNLTATDPSAVRALGQARANLALLRERLAGAGFGETPLTTEQVSVLPNYQETRDAEISVATIDANLTVVISDVKPSSLGAILDAVLLDRGVQIYSVQFYVSDISSARKQARAKAVENARVAAMTYAAAAGQSLGNVVQISELDRQGGFAVAATREFTPASQTVSAKVMVVFQLIPQSAGR